MLRIARWLRVRGGFWFPAFKWLLDRLFRAFSLGHQLNNFLERKLLGGPWVSEVYQLLSVLIGLCWIALIERPVLTAIYWIVFGLVVVFYRILEILLFSLHWLFVAKRPVESYGRSLLGFLINLCEIGIFFAIAYLLLGWFDPPQGAWSGLFKSLSSVFSLQPLSGLHEARCPRVTAWFQLAISWVLIVLIVANVVGGISRGEKKLKGTV